MVDGSNVHGRFFLLPGQLAVEQDLDLPEQLDGVDAVELVRLSEVSFQGRIFDFELFIEYIQYRRRDFRFCYASRSFVLQIR